jgi:hypothetical protein
MLPILSASVCTSLQRTGSPVNPTKPVDPVIAGAVLISWRGHSCLRETGMVGPVGAIGAPALVNPRKQAIDGGDILAYARHYAIIRLA